MSTASNGPDSVEGCGNEPGQGSISLAGTMYSFEMRDEWGMGMQARCCTVVSVASR